MSKYVIFNNAKINKTLIYYPCPKNANTSAKMFFARHGNVADQYLFVGDNVPQKHEKNEHYQGKKSIISFLPSKQPFEKRDVDLKCCILRDPVKRFISAYKNRILYHGDSEFNNHTVDMIIEKLENNNFENKHFLPQTFFLGPDINYYSFWATTDNIHIFVDRINDFFGRKIEFPKIQTGGNEAKINLSNSQIERIEKIYFNDYKLIKT